MTPRILSFLPRKCSIWALRICRGHGSLWVTDISRLGAFKCYIKRAVGTGSQEKLLNKAKRWRRRWFAEELWEPPGSYALSQILSSMASSTSASDLSWVRSNTHSGPGGGQITPGRAPPTTTLPKQGALLCLDAWLVVEMEEKEQS